MARLTAAADGTGGQHDRVHERNRHDADQMRGTKGAGVVRGTFRVEIWKSVLSAPSRMCSQIHLCVRVDVPIKDCAQLATVRTLDFLCHFSRVAVKTSHAS